MDLVKELVLLKQEFEKRASEIESESALGDIENGITSFHNIITTINNLSLNDHYHQSKSQNVSKDEVHPLDGQVSEKFADTWQKCPKCDGQGIVSKPPYVAGDVYEWSSTSAVHTCDVCNGAKIIKR